MSRGKRTGINISRGRRAAVPAARGRREAGVTLVELVIALVVLSVLASFAIPTYQQSIQKSRRADARSTLGSLAQRLERCNTQFGRYDHAGCNVVSPQPSEEGYYQVAVVRNAVSFTLTASPVGPQSKDGRCTTLVLDHTGRRSATGSDTDQCW